MDPYTFAEDIDYAAIFTEMLGHPFQIPKQDPHRYTARMPDSMLFDADSEAPVGLFGGKGDAMIESSWRSFLSGREGPEDSAQEGSEQELEDNPELDTEQGHFVFGDDEPEQSVQRESEEEEREQGLEELSELGVSQSDYESDDDDEPDHSAPRYEAGNGQIRLFHNQHPSLGPVHFPSKPVYASPSPYPMAQVQQPQATQSGSAKDPITLADSPILRPSPAPLSHYSQHRMPGLIPRPPKSIAGMPSSHNPQNSQPAPIPGSLPRSRMLTATRASTNRAPLSTPANTAAPTIGTSIASFVAPPPVSAVAPFVASARPPAWSAFIAPSQASAANPAGFAAAHALIARTPFRAQGTKGPYATQGQDRGDFLAFIRNSFVPHYFRQFYPHRSVPGSFIEKRNWYRALPQWEKSRLRRFIQQKVEAELPSDVVAEVKRLREGAPTILMGDAANSRLIAASDTRLSGALHGMGNATRGGLHLAMASTRGVRTRQINGSQQGIGGNTAIDLQNMPQARMQDAADGGLRFGPGAGSGAIQPGYTGYQPSEATTVSNGPNGHRHYQQRPRPSNQSVGVFEKSTASGARPSQHHQTPPSLFHSPFDEINLHSSMQPRVGSGYGQQSPYQAISSNSVRPALRQQPASFLNGGAHTEQTVTNNTMHPPQQTLHSTVVGYYAAGPGHRTSTIYPVPTHNVQSQQLHYQSGHQVQRNSLAQRDWGVDFGNRHLPSGHSVTTANTDAHNRNYRRQNHDHTEILGTRSTNDAGSVWAGVLQTNSGMHGSKRKPYDDNNDDNNLVDNEARPTKHRRT
jgi:hypothetical protein